MSKNYPKTRIVYHETRYPPDTSLCEAYWQIHKNHLIADPKFLAEGTSLTLKKLEKYIFDTAYLAFQCKCKNCGIKISEIAYNQFYAQLILDNGTVCHNCMGPLVARQMVKGQKK